LVNFEAIAAGIELLYRGIEGESTFYLGAGLLGMIALSNLIAMRIDHLRACVKRGASSFMSGLSPSV
jgi:hypothetical protein